MREVGRHTRLTYHVQGHMGTTFFHIASSKWIELVYKTYIFVTTKLTHAKRLLWGMTSEEPAVLKGVCKWNSQSKKLTERARHLSWRLHSLKARTFWMHFKNMGVYKHQHSKTYDAESGARCLLHILAVTLLPLLFNLIVEGFIRLGSLTLWNWVPKKHVFIE